VGISWQQLLIILLLVLVVFGAKKLRTIGSDLGTAVKGFKKAMNEAESDDDTPPVKQLKQDARDAEFPEVAAKQNADRTQDDRKS
jgi:sec-independent protein translocase protein TatA